MEDVAMAVVLVGGILTAWRMWLHRPSARPQIPAAQPNAALESRLDRLENAIEAMTIEIERVTEGQRFTTKLLSEIHDAKRAIAAGQ